MTKPLLFLSLAVFLAARLSAASVTATPSPTTVPTVLPTVSAVPTLPTIQPTILPTTVATPTAGPTPMPSPTASAQAVLGSNLFRPAKGPLSISWRPLKAGPVSVRIFSLEGARVRALPVGQVGAALGTWAQTDWDGRDDQGREIASGLYLVSVQGGGIQKVLKVDLLR
jgi:hypothetical protein